MDSDSPALLSGSTIRARGIKINNQMAIASSRGKDLQILNSKLPGHTVKKVAVILINFQNDQSQPFTPELIRGKIFTDTNSVKAYYQEASFNQLILEGKNNSDGDIFGWFMIPYENGFCEPNIGGLAESGWRQAADAAAQATGVDLTGYDNIIYIFPRITACGWKGMAQIGGIISMINTYPANFPTRMVAHELGHNYGVRHARSYSCSNAEGQPVTLGINCNYNEYGDPFDVMGKSSLFRHLNNFHKRELNWFTDADGTAVTSFGEYEFELTPAGQAGGGTKFIRVERGSNVAGNPLPESNVAGNSLPDLVNSFYLEYRQPTGLFDNFDSSEPVVNGVSLRLGSTPSDSKSTHLIDATPATNTFKDSALAAGQTFVDEISGISITTENVSPSNALVRITKAQPMVCYHSNPSIFIEPESQVANKAGQTLTYTARVRNNDNAACAAQYFSSSSFDYTELLESWSLTPMYTENLLSPGQETTFNVVVTSPSNALPGAYQFAMNVRPPDYNYYRHDSLYYWIYDCTSGACVSPCGNGVVNPGENCGNCQLDVSCP